MTIGLYRKMTPSDWYITGPDEKMPLRLNFTTQEDAQEAKTFMEKVFEAGRRRGQNEAANTASGTIQTLADHIEDCERTLLALKGFT